MPNRILRDYTDSEAVNRLSAEGERLFVRLFMKADDYGRFSANPELLRSYLFPLNRDALRTTDISRWLAECASAGLIVVYSAAGKAFLEIVNFGQRVRAPSKYPPPPGSGSPDQVAGDPGGSNHRAAGPEPPLDRGLRSNDRGPPSFDRPGAGAGANQQQQRDPPRPSSPLAPTPSIAAVGGEHEILAELRRLGLSENRRTRAIAARWAGIPDAVAKMTQVAQRVRAAGKGDGAVVLQLEAAAEREQATGQESTARQMALIEEKQRLRREARESLEQQERQARILAGLGDDELNRLKAAALELPTYRPFRDRWRDDDPRTNRLLGLAVLQLWRQGELNRQDAKAPR